MSRLGWWELGVVAEKLGFSRRDHLASLVTRLIGRGIIEPNQFSRERGETSSVGGRPGTLVFLAPVAVAALAAHASTPEAAAFRRETFAGLAETQVQALPAGLPALPAPSADVAVLQRVVFELERRFDAMVLTQGAVVERVERIERRIPEQLRLPGVATYRVADLNEQVRALVEALRELGESPDGRLQGWKCHEMLALVKSGDPRAGKLRAALEVCGLRGCSPKTLGEKLYAVRMVAGDELQARKDRKAIARWFVVSNATH